MRIEVVPSNSKPCREAEGEEMEEERGVGRDPRPHHLGDAKVQNVRKAPRGVFQHATELCD